MVSLAVMDDIIVSILMKPRIRQYFDSNRRRTVDMMQQKGRAKFDAGTVGFIVQHELWDGNVQGPFR